jgi:hypothetical protein
MKRFIGVVITSGLFLIIIGGGSIVWYASYCTHFSRNDRALKTENSAEAPLNQPGK